MIEAILVVLTNPVEGRDDDFNDWYTNIHTRDAMRFRGSIAQQRFSFAQERVQDYPNGFVAKYLALYEVYDAAKFSSGARRQCPDIAHGGRQFDRHLTAQRLS